VAARVAEAGGGSHARAHATHHLSAPRSPDIRRVEARRAAHGVAYSPEDQILATEAANAELKHGWEVSNAADGVPARPSTYARPRRPRMEAAQDAHARDLRFYNMPPPSPDTYVAPTGDGGYVATDYENTCSSLPMNDEAAYTLTDANLLFSNEEVLTFIKADTRRQVDNGNSTSRVVIPVDLILEDVKYLGDNKAPRCEQNAAGDYECWDSVSSEMVKSRRPSRNVASDLMFLEQAITTVDEVVKVHFSEPCNATDIVVTEVNLGYYDSTLSDEQWWVGPNVDFVPAYVELKNNGDKACRLERWQLTMEGLGANTTQAISFGNHVAVPPNGTFVACHFHAMLDASAPEPHNLLDEEVCAASVDGEDVFYFTVGSDSVIELRAPANATAWDTVQYDLSAAGSPGPMGVSVAFCDEDSSKAIWVDTRSPGAYHESQNQCAAMEPK